MVDLINLSKAAYYSEDRVNSDLVASDNFVTTDNLISNKGGVEKAVTTPKGTLISYRKGDVLVGNIRPYLRKIWHADKDGGCSPDVLVIRAKIGYDSKFLYYSLLRDDFFEHMMRGSKGTKMPRGDKSQILRFNIPNFEINYQKNIGSLFSSLDSKISLNNRINAELEAMAKTIYDYWFVQFDFPNKKGKPYKASGGKMVWSEELKREIPEGWDVGSVNDLGEIIGGSTPSTDDDDNFETDGTPWITPKDLSLNIGNKYITKGAISVSQRGIEKASLKIMPEGTILLSSRAPIGYMAISREPVTTNQGFKNIVPNKGYSTEMVYYLIKNLIPVIEKNSSGSTFKEISGSVLKSIKVLLPNKKQSTSLSEILSPIFRKQNLLELENQKLTELRDWLLPMLMNGQIKIKDAEEELAMAAEPEVSYRKTKII